MSSTKSAIVIGAGIVGLATARALAIRGFKVKIFERSQRAVGASIRNFGMVWPIGQPTGELYETALRSRSIWKEACTEAGIWHNENGSLHLAYHDDEWAVLEEFVAENQAGRPAVSLLLKKQVRDKSSVAVLKGLKGALWSSDELIVDPREAIAKLPEYFTEKYGIEFHFGVAATEVHSGQVRTGDGKKHRTDRIFICSGQDFETLYPQAFTDSGITRCKLQMMRTPAQPARLGASLCAGLTLTHYKAFEKLPSLPALRSRFEKEMPEYLKWGIHVLVSQNHAGEVTLGDTHEYGLHLDPFDRAELNDLVLKYLETFCRLPKPQVAETWHGIYAKLPAGKSWLVVEPEPGVTILNGMGGAGMTLSFGLAEQVVRGANLD
ncbi:MAG: TIGR03364 family FAD-dependent oxidoreductase [Saprospiraceae bacterium]|nr:TIGR03364 family FAD-dependent oxidoreductase [Saprospiraceae bacterium]MCF8250530.1 TIGR03364 family FAD-dependent oxidoreductase [Saprospiraceae bacterium]MCF8279670.1 TIGR03364 family FAD-dependent oxidoreductase [Bacteroidales bacterium]MCF8312456.1 TIGR03364 family FAD-dependent oxidoreductase [Saprospiraceae bacterium]MCF8440727.1 TIGR03364 family FAD-dependent oxidoreductase [Saprospiraceae bacterium]